MIPEKGPKWAGTGRGSRLGGKREEFEQVRDRRHGN
jgi:hypothetical protein